LDVGVRALVLLDTVEKVPQVRPFRVARLVRGLDAVVDVPALLVEDERALLAVEGDAPRLALDAGPRPDAVLPDQAGVGKIERYDLGVRRLLVVVVEVFAAAAGDAARRVEPEDPARGGHGGEPVVAH